MSGHEWLLLDDPRDMRGPSRDTGRRLQNRNLSTPPKDRKCDHHPPPAWPPMIQSVSAKISRMHGECVAGVSSVWAGTQLLQYEGSGQYQPIHGHGAPPQSFHHGHFNHPRGRRSSDARSYTPPAPPPKLIRSSPSSPAEPPVIPRTAPPEVMKFRNFLRKDSSDRQTIIYFYDKNKPYYEFTNFSPHPVEYKGKWYPTSEHLFQSFKFTHKPKLMEHIRTCGPRPASAFGEAQRFAHEVHPDWKKVSIPKMEDALYLKFTQHESLTRLLLGTGDAELIEDSDKDSFWGCGADRQGRNELGKALMRLRERLLVERQSW